MTRPTGILLAVIVLALLGGGVYLATSSTSDTETPTDQTNSLESTLDTTTNANPRDDLAPTEPVIADTETISTDIAPDTVTERVEYNLPRGHEGVLAVVAEVDPEGVVESLTYEHQNVEQESVSHHNQFDNSLNPDDYVGVPLDDIEDVFISGASLTSAAFNTAIENLQSRL